MSRIVSPDCRDQNHQKCPGDAWDEAHDHATGCQCNCHAVSPPTTEGVIAAALRQHAVTSWSGESRTTGHCFCSATLTAERATIHAWTRALSDHQAEVVLAAITETCRVEWAVQDVDGLYPPGPASPEAADRDMMLAEIAEAKTLGINMVLVSCLTWTWSAVEK